MDQTIEIVDGLTASKDERTRQPESTCNDDVGILTNALGPMKAGRDLSTILEQAEPGPSGVYVALAVNDVQLEQPDPPDVASETDPPQKKIKFGRWSLLNAGRNVVVSTAAR